MNDFALQAHLRINYLARRMNDLKTLDQSLREGSVAEFHRIGHQLLGNARSFGFASLESIAAKMESLSADDIYDQGRRVLNEFSAWIDEAKKLLF